MIFSSLYSGQFKLDPADVQRSSIAGGVAISSVVSIFALPWMAMVIGFVGGAACSTSHHYLRRFLEKKLLITDTVGQIPLPYPCPVQPLDLFPRSSLSRRDCVSSFNRLGFRV
jgi:ammonia channel protein AmtB